MYRIKKTVMIDILLIMPFFELYSIKLFMNKDFMYPIFYGIDRILAVSRWGITAWMISDYLVNHRKIGMATKIISVFALLRVISSFMNGSFSISIVVGNVTFIGFALLVERLYSKSKKNYVEANTLFFGIFSLIGVSLIFVFPYGFLHAKTTTEAIYFLGSKNYGFYFYLMFLFYWLINSFWKKNRFSQFALPVILLFCAGSYVADSINTLICMLVLAIYITYIQTIKKFTYLLSPKMAIVIICVLAYIFLFGHSVPIIEKFLTLFGRSMSFTGRDYIWSKAISMLKGSAMWGVGYDMEIILMSGAIANHAHNFFLDVLVKYGVFTFCILLWMILFIAKIIEKKQDKRLVIYFSVFLFVNLLHSLLDDMMVYILISVLITMEKVGVNSENNLIKA